MRTKPYLDRQIGQVVTVHTTNGDSISGVLIENFPSGVLLKGARYLDTENPVPLGGEVFIPSSKINFIQGGTDSA